MIQIIEPFEWSLRGTVVVLLFVSTMHVVIYIIQLDGVHRHVDNIEMRRKKMFDGQNIFLSLGTPCVDFWREKKNIGHRTNKIALPYFTPQLRPPWGSVKLISTKLTNIVSLEQSKLKPIGWYGGGLLKLALEGK